MQVNIDKFATGADCVALTVYLTLLLLAVTFVVC